MEKGKDHIRRAMAQLPQKKAPEKVWDRLTAELDREQGVEHLDQALDDMPVLEAPSSVWEALETALDELERDQPLARAIENLPTHQAPFTVDEVLQKEERKIFLLPARSWLTGIAASLLLAMAAYYFYSDKESVVISSYVEVVTPSHEVLRAAVDQLDEEDEILEIVEQYCYQIMLKCESPEFKGLFDYYLELDASKEELMAEIEDHQGQPQLVEYLVRVEKEKNEVGKQLIQLILG